MLRSALELKLKSEAGTECPGFPNRKDPQMHSTMTAIVLALSGFGALPSAETEVSALPVALEAQPGSDVQAPVLEPSGANLLSLSGASYARISPPAPIHDHSGVPVDLADLVFAWGDGSPIVWETEPGVSYTVTVAVRFDVPDDGSGNPSFGTEMFELAYAPDRIDRIQSLILLSIEKINLERSLGTIDFSEVIEAVERLRDSGQLPNSASSLRTLKEALDDQ